MGIAVYTDPPRVVYDMSDLSGSQGTSQNYAGAYPTNNEAVYGTFLRQRGHSFSVSYAVRNGGPENYASGEWTKAEAFLQGLNPSPNFTSDTTETNYDGEGNILAESQNLFDEPTATYADTPRTLTLNQHAGVFSPHSYTFQHEGIVSYQSLIRPDILQALINAYPSGTITFLVNVPSSQTQEWDIHSGFVYVSVLHTQVWNTPEATFPLSDFGIPPDGGGGGDGDCPCDWTAGGMPTTTWAAGSHDCASYTASPLPTTSWTKQGCG